jgi:hypothetical protein
MKNSGEKNIIKSVLPFWLLATDYWLFELLRFERIRRSRMIERFEQLEARRAE